MGKKKQARKLAKKLAKADATATHALARYRNKAPVRLAGFLGDVADQPQLILASVGTIGIGLMTKRRDLVRGGARMLASHLIATAAKAALKANVDRSRPAKTLADGKETLQKGSGGGDHDVNSFPSGHTAGAVAVARAASRDIDGVATPAALGAGAVAAMQPPTGAHYITDVVIGAAVGWLAEAVASAILERVEPAIEHVVAPASSPA